MSKGSRVAITTFSLVLVLGIPAIALSQAAGSPTPVGPKYRCASGVLEVAGGTTLTCKRAGAAPAKNEFGGTAHCMRGGGPPMPAHGGVCAGGKLVCNASAACPADSTCSAWKPTAPTGGRTSDPWVCQRTMSPPEFVAPSPG